MKISAKFISFILSAVMLLSVCLPGFGAYAQDSYIKGVDVSQHNGSVDFASLKSDGYDFVMIRLGWLDTSSGEHIDTCFLQ
ncbi:MAG: hypothetical protein LUG95_06355 [Clostridiales bacterium]|nr:hypothetical protein [Clostridiales bacterium]